MKKNTSLFSTFIFLANQVKLRLFSILIFVFLLLTSLLQSQTIYNIQFSPASPCQLSIYNSVSISLDYRDFPDNAARLYALPIAGSERGPINSSTHTIDPSGNGHAELHFSTGTAELNVDGVAIVISDNNYSEIGEFDIPVDYEFSDNAITNISVSPASPAALQYDQTVTITFHYSTNSSENVEFTAHARYSGHDIMNQAIPSPSYPTPSGDATVTFNLETNGGFGASADEIRIAMFENPLYRSITETYFPVQYQFGYNVISDFHAAVATPASLPLDQDLSVYYKYTTNEAAGVKVRILPYHGATLITASSTSGVASYSQGSGSGSGSFKITKGPTLVDRIRVSMRNSDESELLYERFEPVSYFFSDNAISKVTVTPSSPAYISNSTTATVNFSFTEDVTENIKIEGQCYTGGSPTPGSTAVSTSLLSGGNGNLNLTVNGVATVDQVRLRMLNTAGTTTYVDLYVPVELHFLGDILTDVKNNSNAPLSFGLKQNYPNPFNPTTKIAYSVPVVGTSRQFGTVSLRIFDMLGREVAILVNGMQSAGEHTVEWNAQNYSSGVYFYRLHSGKFTETKKLILLK